MMLEPKSIGHLQQLLKGSQQVETAALQNIANLIEHVPEDMTATVEAGLTVAELQRLLAKGGQWLPVDPPNPESITVGDLLSENLSGPRRFGCGTIRDWVIGMAMVLPDGTLIRNGGKVVKNVAGFDLCRLFIGAQNTLGIIVEATFKLQPLPEAEVHLAKQFGSLGQAEECLEKIWNSELQPVVLDLDRLGEEAITLVVGFAGPSADVEAQKVELSEQGFGEVNSLAYDEQFRSQPHSTKSIAPGNLFNALNELGDAEFVARAGNGVVYFLGDPPDEAKSASTDLSELERRLKKEFDPENKLPTFRRQ
jgi:FAD/FMN-containing dehydrogenase